MLLLGGDNNKKLATVIVGKLKKGKKSEDEGEAGDPAFMSEKMDDEETDEQYAYKAAAKSFLRAVKDDDPEMVADSMMALVESCMARVESSSEYRDPHEVG